MLVKALTGTQGTTASDWLLLALGNQPMLLVPAFDWYYYADDWLTLLTAVLADKPLGRQRPLTTGPKDVTGL